MILSDTRQLASLQRGESVPDVDQQRRDTTQLVRTIRNNIGASFKATEAWRNAALESYNFMENDQWTEEEKKFLKEQKRPILTFNKVLPIVRMLSGIERQNREELKVLPRQGSSVEEASIMTELVKFVEDDNLGAWIKTRKSNDLYICGRGYIKTDISYDENLSGDVVFSRRNPLSVFIDSLSESWDGSDWRWVADSVWLTKEEAKDLWPEFEDLIQVGDWLKGEGNPLITADLSGDRDEQNRLFLDQKTERVRVFEYWYKQVQTVEVAVSRATGNVRTVDEAFSRAYELLDPEEQSKIQIIRRKMPVIRVATLMNWLLLQDQPSPFKHGLFPVIPYVGLQFYREPFGIVEYLKDPQKLRNKAYSQALNHLNRSANSGWLNKAASGADSKTLEKFGSVPGVVIEYLQDKPNRIEPVPLSQGHFQLVRDVDQEIKEISLINAELQGLTTQTTVSGRAIEARQRGGLVGNEDLFDNQLLGDKILGLQIISLIQQVYTPERVVRIVENQVLRDPAATLATIAKGANLPELIDRTLKADYDFVVDRAPTSATVRQEQLKTLMDYAKQFPGSIPPDVIVDLTDLAENLKSRLKEHLQAKEQASLQLQRPNGPLPPELGVEGGLPGVG